jgi:simple sugar transport system ATP-binding protein
VAEIGERYGLVVDPDARIADLTAGQRQRVEIIKCLRREPSIIVFDEPTSVLTPAESEQLFSVLRGVVVAQGRTVALVSHKLDEILHATDEVTIMRGGRVVDRRVTSEATAPELAQSMVGRPVSLRSEGVALGAVDLATLAARVSSDADADAAEVEELTPVLAVDDAVVLGADGRRLLDELSIVVYPGEIVGLAGVEGNGQRALADLLSSLVPLESGSVSVGGSVVATGKPGALAGAGIGVIPEDRHDSGCVLDMSVAENLILAHLRSVGRWGVLDRGAMEERARQLMKEFEISAPSPATPMRMLSGGNQQRVVLARELSAQPRVLVAAQPTRGLDVGAIEYMSARLREVAASGVAVLLISTELEEVLALSDRVCVIHSGRVVGEMARHEVDPERLGLMLGGIAA